MKRRIKARVRLCFARLRVLKLIKLCFEMQKIPNKHSPAHHLAADSAQLDILIEIKVKFSLHHKISDMRNDNVVSPFY